MSVEGICIEVRVFDNTERVGEILIGIFAGTEMDISLSLCTSEFADCLKASMFYHGGSKFLFD